MRNCLRIIVMLLLLAVAMDKVVAQGSTLNGYTLQTAVDSTLWLTPDSVTTIDWANCGNSVNVNIGFDFQYFGEIERDLFVDRFGCVSFGNVCSRNALTQSPFSNIYVMRMGRIIIPFGRWFSWNDSSLMEYGWVGTEGHRVLVITADISKMSDTVSYQIQLSEFDNSVSFVYGHGSGSVLSNPFDLGLINNTSEYLQVQSDGYVRYYLSNNPSHYDSPIWPQPWRVLRFVPQNCQRRIKVDATYVSPTSALLTWDDTLPGENYRIVYGPSGFPRGTGTVINTNKNYSLMTNLNPMQEYDIYAQVLCDYNSVYTHTTYCGECHMVGNEVNRIKYWEIDNPDVHCKVGRFLGIDNDSGMEYNSRVDLGSSEILSRHTVHSNIYETDLRTGDSLHTVPEGHCYSVRLGNWDVGAEWESIEYELKVDTMDYDLLILRYAVVEENPSHDSVYQPYFTFGLYDSLGVLLDSCSYANFVSGLEDGWNLHRYNGHHILWHDWAAVGVDLSAFQGRTIRVRLENADCKYSGHYGYGYFTLESAHKLVRSEHCGVVEENTYFAPAGFNYKWYAVSDTSNVLSTTNDLFVNDTGTYRCEVSYSMNNHNCGFNLEVAGGTHLPHADFEIVPVSGCGKVSRLINHSCVALDTAHHQLSNMPCESYLWVFDDGSYSSLPNPVHDFHYGQNVVKLCAKLAGGECVDSVVRTLYVPHDFDTIYDTTCKGRDYIFYGNTYVSTGTYDVHTPCGDYVLHLFVKDYMANEGWLYDAICEGQPYQLCGYTFNTTGFHPYSYALDGCTYLDSVYLYVLPSIRTSFVDTFLIGSTYHYHDRAYIRPGIYSDTSTATVGYMADMGCDSIFTLRLHSIEFHDTTVCASALPFTWHATTISQAFFDTLHYTSTLGADSMVVLRVRVHEMAPLALDPVPVCELDGYYMPPLDDTLRYRWVTTPVDTLLPSGYFMGGDYPLGFVLRPSVVGQYVLIAENTDQPLCPTSDTVELEEIVSVLAAIYATPDWVHEDALDIEAIDLSQNANESRWYVNDQERQADGNRLSFKANPGDDSVVIVLISTNLACADTSRAVIPIKRQRLWFPNVFTPDEPTNNLFLGRGLEVVDYDLKVFTKWGDCIFHTKDINEGWDGTYRGVSSPQSAYVYLCHYKNLSGEPCKVYGTVTLVR